MDIVTLNEWRTYLYPFGFFSAIFFGLRFLVQWIQSEQAQKSMATSAFWYLSLAGNSCLFIHSFVQLQFHICLIQACNIVISWRNLNLMQPVSKHYSLKTVYALFGFAILFTTLSFIGQEWALQQHFSWMRVPQASWQTSSLTVSFTWHLLGIIGYSLYSIRFWVQWWVTEKKQTSTLPLSFWWLSLIGAILSIFYFISIQDSVNLVGPLIGIIPYIRNLLLIRKNRLT